jgi:hypothetical protein
MPITCQQSIGGCVCVPVFASALYGHHPIPRDRIAYEILHLEGVTHLTNMSQEAATSVITKLQIGLHHCRVTSVIVAAYITFRTQRVRKVSLFGCAGDAAVVDCKDPQTRLASVDGHAFAKSL